MDLILLKTDGNSESMFTLLFSSKSDIFVKELIVLVEESNVDIDNMLMACGLGGRIMKVLNSAIVGMGGRASAHLPVILKLSDKYRLVAICDIDKEKALSVANRLGTKAYDDIEEMVNNEHIDACLIATQAESHHAIAKFLAEKKVNILLETPIAIDVQCANIMIRSAEQNHVYLEVSENVRRWPHERLKRKIVESGLLGEIKEFYLSYTSGSYHGVSGIRAILGSEAMSVKGNFPQDEDVLEQGFIEWSGGINGVYEYKRSRGNYWEIIGSKGAIKGSELHIDNKVIRIMTETFKDEPLRTIKRSYVQTEPEISWENPYKEYPLPSADEVAIAEAWCSLYDAIVYGEDLDYGAENAKRDVELIVAIRGSAMSNGRVITLPMRETNEYERLLHSEFKKFYGIDILDLSVEHLKKRYTLPSNLRELMYYGRVIKGSTDQR